MKVCKYFLGAAALLALTGCVDKDPEMHFFPNPDVDFTYAVEGNEYKYDFYVVSTIQFNNTSSSTGNFTWDFGDGTTSNEVSPTHKYEKAGMYKVRLTNEKGYREYPLLIIDITPTLTVKSTSTEIIEFNKTLVDFNMELPNPEHLKVKYEWTFPDGTYTEDGQPLTTFIGYSDENGNIDYPGKVKFANIGSQRIDIRTYFDVDGANRRLEDSYLNVQVGVTEPAPTLYYAQMKGNIKAYKLLDNIPAGTKVLPYDLGVSAGSTVFNLLLSNAEPEEDGKTNDWIYILDAGKQYYYVNDTDGVLGDGLITALRADGTDVNTVITNVGGAAFLDPFIGVIRDNMLYYTDRNTGVSAVDISTRGAVQSNVSSTERAEYAMRNNFVPYYGRYISYGSITSGLYYDKAGWWWMSKKYNGEGIFRYRDSDVYKTQKEAEAVPVPAPFLLSGMKITTFTIDETSKQLYVWRRAPDSGFLVYDLPSITESLASDAKPNTYIAMYADPVNTTADEGLHTTQFALDKNSGRVYFCFRPETGDTSGATAGVNYYDPTDKKIHKYGEDKDLGTGIVINPRKTQLF